jgi:dTMP kinase
MKKGKLIVLDGTDGSGKATQIKLLERRLKKEGYRVKILDFPEYYKNFFGAFIAHCLTERYYDWINVHPKIASIAYAADRWESKQKIAKWLREGYILLSNRYVSANQIHQGGKIRDATKRRNFIKWLENMEYEVFRVPKPNVVFYLNLPMSVILRLIKERRRNSARAYTKKRKDIVEGNVPYLKNSHRAGLWLAGRERSWVKIECAQDGKIESPEKIHEKIYTKVKKILKK